MIFVKSIFVVFIHFFFIYSLVTKMLEKHNFNYQIYISSLSTLFFIVFIIYVFNILNTFFLFISIIGSIFFIFDFIKNKNYKNNKFTFYLTLFLIIFALTILPPLTSWDGRSIWFFHSKIIYFEKSLWSQTWFNEEILFSQIHYPKLNAIISAYFTNLIGVWNYHFSKISLSLLIFPTFIFFYTSAEMQKYKWISIFFIIIFFKNDLFNGYMDAILAVYSLIGLFILSLIFINLKDLNENLTILGLTIFVITNLKDEGMVISSIIMLLFLFFIVKNFKLLLKKKFFYIFLFIVITSFIYNLSWKYFVYNSNNLAFFGENKINNIKFNYGDILLILDFLIIQSNLIFYFVSLILIFLLNIMSKSRKIITEFSLLIIIFSVLYLLVITLVYLISPLDTSWHLHSSANRVLDTIKFSIMFCILINLMKNYGNKYF
jgi:hypothetical protein